MTVTRTAPHNAGAAQSARLAPVEGNFGHVGPPGAFRAAVRTLQVDRDQASEFAIQEAMGAEVVEWRYTEQDGGKAWLGLAR